MENVLIEFTVGFGPNKGERSTTWLPDVDPMINHLIKECSGKIIDKTGDKSKKFMANKIINCQLYERNYTEEELANLPYDELKDIYDAIKNAIYEEEYLDE